MYSGVEPGGGTAVTQARGERLQRHVLLQKELRAAVAGTSGLHQPRLQTRLQGMHTTRTVSAMQEAGKFHSTDFREWQPEQVCHNQNLPALPSKGVCETLNIWGSSVRVSALHLYFPRSVWS